MAKNVPIWEKAMLTVEEAAAYTNIGINKVREMADDPMCMFVLRVGKKKLINRKRFVEYLESCVEI